MLLRSVPLEVPSSSVMDSLMLRITGAIIPPPRAVLEGIKGASMSSVAHAAYPRPVEFLPKIKKQSNAIRLPRFVLMIVPEMRIAETTSHVVVFPNPANAVFNSMYGVSVKASANTNTLSAINTSGAIANGRRINPSIVAIKIAKIRQPVRLSPLGGSINQRIVAKTTQIRNRLVSDMPLAALVLWWEDRLNMPVG